MRRSFVAQRKRSWAMVAAFVTAASLCVASAQGFDANRYFAQCLAFEGGGDYTSALEACRNAEQVDGERLDVQLALARIDVELDERSRAESRLRRIASDVGTAEPWLLLARLAVDGRRPIDADVALTRARSVLATRPDRRFEAEAAFLQGSSFDQQGRPFEAIASFDAAIAGVPSDVRFVLAAATLQLRLGLVDAADEILDRYVTATDDDRNAAVTSLSARVAWARGDLATASSRFETASLLWTRRDDARRAEDLRSLSLTYLAAGDLARAVDAARDALTRGNQLASLPGNVVAWLVALLLLVTGHLLGEARTERRDAYVMVSGPRPWTVGDLYRIVATSGLVAAAASVAYGAWSFGNPLAFLTPVASGDARAIGSITFAVVSCLQTLATVRLKGWRTATLLGDLRAVPAGIGVGLAMVAATIGFFAIAPGGAWGGRPWIDVALPSPWVVAAVATLPLAEFTLRPFAMEALTRRYDVGFALGLSALVSALVIGTPVVLWIPFGLVLAELYRRMRSGAATVVAHTVLGVGLLIASTTNPWVLHLLLP